MVPAKAPWQTVSVLTDLLEGKHQETWVRFGSVRFRSGVPEKAVQIGRRVGALSCLHNYCIEGLI